MGVPGAQLKGVQLGGELPADQDVELFLTLAAVRRRQCPAARPPGQR
jgi:hypothetical protein